MAVQFRTKDRVLETSVTTGAGTYTLAGAATGFQTFAGGAVAANDQVPYYAEDGTNWEAGIGTVLTGPARLQRDTILASSNGGAAVNWGAGTRNLRCGWPAELNTPRIKSVSIAGGAGDQALTQDQMRCDILVLTGALTGNRNAIVDVAPWKWIVFNNTTGAFTATLKVTGLTGIAVTQGKSKLLYNNGVDVFDAYTDIAVTTPLPRSYLAGCGIANGTDTVNDIDVSAGVCRDSTNAVNISVAAMAGKQLDVGWAPGAAAGMRNSGAAIANTTYHIYAVSKADGTQDIYAHTSLVVATVIAALQAEAGGASYLYARRIASIVRAGATIVQFVQDGDLFEWLVPAADISATNPGAAAVTATLTLPVGLKLLAWLGFGINNVTTAYIVGLLSALAVTDTAPSATVFSLSLVGSSGSSTNFASGDFQIETNVSAQIRYRLSASGASDVVHITTKGWIDRRGRDD